MKIIFHFLAGLIITSWAHATPPIPNVIPASGTSVAPSPSPSKAVEFDARGYDKYTKGDLDGAIDDFNQALAIDPKLAEAYNRRGNANKAKGNTDAAIADYQQAAVIDPNYANPRNNLGLMKVKNGDLDGALADFNQAIALDPKLAQAYLNRGMIERDKADLKEAIADFNQAITLDPRLTPTQPLTYNSLQEARSFANLVQKADPTIVDFVSTFNLKGDTLEVTVTDSYIHSPYDSRLQFAGALYKLWSSFHNSKAHTYVSPVSLINATGIGVGGVDVAGKWVKRDLVFVAGTVLQKVEGGVILHGISENSPYPWNDVPKGMKAIAVFDRVFIKGYRGDGIDGALVELTAYRDGTLSYTTVLGASSTIASYTKASQ